MQQLRIMNVFKVTGKQISKYWNECENRRILFEKSFPKFTLTDTNKVIESSYYFQFYNGISPMEEDSEAEFIVFEDIHKDGILTIELENSPEDLIPSLEILTTLDHYNKIEFNFYPLPTYLVYNLQYEGEGESTECIITIDKELKL